MDEIDNKIFDVKVQGFWFEETYCSAYKYILHSPTLYDIVLVYCINLQCAANHGHLSNQFLSRLIYTEGTI